MWYSLLPPELIHLESWAASFFFFLGLITIGPWAFLVLLDATIWIYHMVLWELPWIGGRARGQRRPRAPSLNARPSGRRRAFGLRGVEKTDAADSEEDDCDEMSDSGWSEGRDSRNHSASPVQELNPPSSGGGILKQRSSG